MNQDRLFVRTFLYSSDSGEVILPLKFTSWSWDVVMEEIYYLFKSEYIFFSLVYHHYYEHFIALGSKLQQKLSHSP
jgi:hypothetical protein